MIWDEIEFWELVNRYNRFTNVYTTVYGAFSSFYSDEKVDYESGKIDRAYFDLDPGEYWFFPGSDSNDLDKLGRPRNWPVMYKKVCKMEMWLWRHNIAHTTVFSGGGFNFYIFTTPYGLKHPKDCLTRFHRWMNDKFKLHLDPSCIGDVAKISRVYGTFNKNKKRWCLCLTHEEVMSGLDKIFVLSLNQHTKWILIGKRRLNIKKFDVPFEHVQLDFLKEKASRMTGDDKSAYEFLTDRGIYKEEIPSCIQAMLRTPGLRYYERWALILWCMDNQLSMQETAELLHKCLSEDRFAHCVTFKGASKEARKKARFCERQLEYMYEQRKRGKDYYLSCKKMKEIQWCPGEKKCNTGCTIYPT